MSYQEFYNNQTVRIFAYIIGAIASLIMISSYLFRKPRRIMIFQFAATLIFAIAGVFFGQVVGALMNTICAARCIFFYLKKKKHWIWPTMFLLLSLIPYILGITVLKDFLYSNYKNPATVYLVNLLPIVGLGFSTIGFFLCDEKKIKILAMCGLPFWIAYDVIGGATPNIPGITCDIVSIGLIIFTLIKNKNKESIKE